MPISLSHRECQGNFFYFLPVVGRRPVDWCKTKRNNILTLENEDGLLTQTGSTIFTKLFPKILHFCQVLFHVSFTTAWVQIPTGACTCKKVAIDLGLWAVVFARYSCFLHQLQLANHDDCCDTRLAAFHQ